MWIPLELIILPYLSLTPDFSTTTIWLFLYLLSPFSSYPPPSYTLSQSPILISPYSLIAFFHFSLLHFCSFLLTSSSLLLSPSPYSFLFLLLLPFSHLPTSPFLFLILFSPSPNSLSSDFLPHNPLPIPLLVSISLSITSLSMFILTFLASPPPPRLFPLYLSTHSFLALLFFIALLSLHLFSCLLTLPPTLFPPVPSPCLPTSLHHPPACLILTLSVHLSPYPFPLTSLASFSLFPPTSFTLHLLPMLHYVPSIFPSIFPLVLRLPALSLSVLSSCCPGNAAVHTGSSGISEPISALHTDLYLFSLPILHKSFSRNI